jgi:hypothetical protein
MTPTSAQIELLREVARGRNVFGPKSDSNADVESFQILAEEVIELCDNNFLTGCSPKRESYSGKGQIVRVLVAGLTAAGRRLVQSTARITSDENVEGVVCPNCEHSVRTGAKFCDDLRILPGVHPRLDSSDVADAYAHLQRFFRWPNSPR